MVPMRKHRLAAAGIEACLLPVAAEHPRQHQAAEEQHLGREKQPHAGDRCLGLMVGARDIGSADVRGDLVRHRAGPAVGGG